MNYPTYDSKPEAEMPQIMAMIRTVGNGYVFTINGRDFVIQGTGDHHSDFQQLLEALTIAWERAGGFNGNNP